MIMVRVSFSCNQNCTIVHVVDTPAVGASVPEPDPDQQDGDGGTPAPDEPFCRNNECPFCQFLGQRTCPDLRCYPANQNCPVSVSEHVNHLREHSPREYVKHADSTDTLQPYETLLYYFIYGRWMYLT